MAGMSGVLSDISIQQAIDKGALVVDPYDPENIQPSSFDVRLGNTFRIFKTRGISAVDVRADNTGLTESVTPEAGQPFILHPHEFALGHTMEVVGLPDNIAARLEGKSSLGRLGLLIHSTAGFVDPGFNGDLTLELSNVLGLPIELYPGMLIGQLSFHWMDQPVQHQYDGHYQGQRGPNASRFHEHFIICDICKSRRQPLFTADIKTREGEEWVVTGEQVQVCGDCLDAASVQGGPWPSHEIPVLYELKTDLRSLRQPCEDENCATTEPHMVGPECVEI